MTSMRPAVLTVVLFAACALAGWGLAIVYLSRKAPA